jgi:hypothetical protein
MRANAASIPSKGVTMSSRARLGKKRQPALSSLIIAGCSELTFSLSGRNGAAESRGSDSRAGRNVGHS